MGDDETLVTCFSKKLFDRIRSLGVKCFSFYPLMKIENVPDVSGMFILGFSELDDYLDYYHDVLSARGIKEIIKNITQDTILKIKPEFIFSDAMFHNHPQTRIMVMEDCNVVDIINAVENNFPEVIIPASKFKPDLIEMVKSNTLKKLKIE